MADKTWFPPMFPSYQKALPNTPTSPTADHLATPTVGVLREWDRCWIGLNLPTMARNLPTPMGLFKMRNAKKHVFPVWRTECACLSIKSAIKSVFGYLVWH